LKNQKFSLITWYNGFFTTALIVGWYLSSYTHVKLLESISGPTFDNWCNPGKDGIGQHCFSDFYYPQGFLNYENPYIHGPNPYPPFALLLVKIFDIIGNIFGNRLSLFIYFVFSLTLYLVAIKIFINKLAIAHREKLSLATIFFSAPFLSALDRGNQIIILISLVILFTVSILTQDFKRSIVFGVLIFALKPQFFLLGLLYLSFEKRWSKILVWLGVNTLVFFGSFAVFGVNFYQVLYSYVNQLTNYNAYTNAGSPYPLNISLANTWSIWSRVLAFIGINPSHSSYLGTWNYYSTKYTVITLIFVVIILIYSKLNFQSKYLLIILSPILLPNVSFGYYLATLIPFYAIIFSTNQISNKLFYLVTEKNNFQHFLILCIPFFLFIPWVMPLSIFSTLSSYVWSKGNMIFIIGQSMLAVLYYSIILSGLTQIIRKNIKFNGITH